MSRSTTTMPAAACLGEAADASSGAVRHLEEADMLEQTR